MLDGQAKKKGIFGIALAGVLALSISLLVSCGYKTKKTEESDGSGTGHGSKMEESVSEDSTTDIDPDRKGVLNNEEDANIPADAVLNVNEVEEGQWEMAKQTPDFAVSVDYGEGEERIILLEASDQTALNEIPVTKDQGMVFINMINENSGYLLYCSSPAAGLMNKTLYATKDRWKTYSEIDISSKIDGYPNSLSAVSKDKIYIGTQMRSNGYLFATKDQGENFEAVWVEEEKHFRYGYAPLFDKESRRGYLILEAENEYFVYQAEYPTADDEDSCNLRWEKVGKFILEDYDTIEEYFLYGGQVYLTDRQGKRCRINLD